MKAIIISIFVIFEFTTLHAQNWMSFGPPGKVNSVVSSGERIICATDVGLFSSVTCGEKWIKMPGINASTEVLALSVNNDTVIAVTSDNIYISEPDGLNFRPILHGDFSDYSVRIPWTHLINSEGISIFGRSNGKAFEYYSSDAGKNWRQVGLPQAVIGQSCIARGITYRINDSSIVKSGDGGGTWVPVSTFGNHSAKHYITYKDGRIFFIRDSSVFGLDPSERVRFMFVASGEIRTSCIKNDTIYMTSQCDYEDSTSFRIYSMINGMDFVRKSMLKSYNESSISVDNYSVIYRSFCRIGVMKSTDGGESWVSASNGINNGYNCLGISAGDNNVFVENNGLSFVSSDNGLRWNFLPLPVNNQYGGSCISKDRIFWSRAPVQGGLYKLSYTDDVCDSWQDIVAPFTTDLAGLRAKNDTIAAQTWESTFLSTDRGISWRNLKLHSNHFNLFRITDHFIAYFSDSSLYISDYNHNPAGYTHPDFTRKTVIIDLLTKKDSVLLLTEDKCYIFNTTNKTWSKLFLPAADVVTSAAIGGDYLFLGTKSGIYYTTDFVNYFEYNFGLNCLKIDRLASNGHLMFAGTDGGGVNILNLDDFNFVGVEDESKLSISDDFVIEPCPAGDFIFVKDIGMRFGLKIEIYDLLSNKLSESQSGGAGKIDISCLPAGAYLLRIGNVSKVFIKS